MMDESYETFEEDLGSQRVDPPPQKPIRPIRRPEMYATRKTKEEMDSVPQQIKAEPKILPREPSFNRSPSIPQPVSTQDVTQTEVPWESVTLNRCLFIAITILVLTSGFQRLHETLHGQGVALDEDEDEFGLAVRRSGALKHRTKPETTLWEVMLSWLPDLDDDDDDDDNEEDDEDEEDEGVGLKKRKPKRRTAAKSPSGLRNKPLPDKKLLKQRDGKIKGRHGKKSEQDLLEEDREDLEEADNEQEEKNEERELKNSSVEKKRKKLSKG